MGREASPAMTIPSDTSPDLERVQLELLRAMSGADRVGLALRLSADVVRLSKRAIARTHAEYTPRQVEHRFVELHYGKELADALRQRDKAREHGRDQ